MRKNIVIFVLALLLVATTAWAATTDFVASADITVTGVTMGSASVDMTIKSGSKSASWSFSSGTFTVTNPDTTAGFTILCSDSTVKTIKVTKASGAGDKCVANQTPGTTELALSTTADTYTITPSVLPNCTDHCPVITNAASYNTYPTCGPATCNSGYAVSTDGTACVQFGGGGVVGGGGGGGGMITLPSTSPSPSASPAATPAPTAVDTSSIKEGALIRATGDIDVYIVKYVGAKKFKRLILSPSVFKSYQHLKWSDVKVVSKSTLDAFTTSELVRAVGDPKVYKLYPAGDTGEKRWVETAAGFNRMSFDWDAIYEINKTDRNSYVTGVAIK